MVSRRPFPLRSFTLLWIAGFVMLLGACAAPSAPALDWLPDDGGWVVRDVDDGEPPGWVLYERDAAEADVKELRIVGIIDAEPERAAQALRERLVDERSDTGVHRVDARTFDPGGEPPRGVVRVPFIRNTWVLAPTGSGQSVFTVDTIHDIGNGLLNAVIHGPICDQLVEDLQTIRALVSE